MIYNKIKNSIVIDLILLNPFYFKVKINYINKESNANYNILFYNIYGD